jgi:hypothetical protein
MHDRGVGGTKDCRHLGDALGESDQFAEFLIAGLDRGAWLQVTPLEVRQYRPPKRGWRAAEPAVPGQNVEALFTVHHDCVLTAFPGDGSHLIAQNWATPHRIA